MTGLAAQFPGAWSGWWRVDGRYVYYNGTAGGRGGVVKVDQAVKFRRALYSLMVLRVFVAHLEMEVKLWKPISKNCVTARRLPPAAKRMSKLSTRKGRLTAQERIDLLFDPGTFSEIDTLVTPRSDKYMDGRGSRYGDGVVTGFGEINGRKVFVASQNAAVMGGSLGEMHANKIVKAMNMAIKYGCPFLALNDSGGARIQEGVDSLGGYAKIFDANCEASGVIPQLSVILGPCAGGAVYSPALTDFVFMTENSYMFITGPEVVRAVMQENVSFEMLGGGMIHSKESGVSHFLSKDDAECLLKVRELLSYLPSNNQDDPPYVPPMDDPDRRCPELEEIVPVDPHKPYDVRQVIGSIVDDGRFFEVHELWAENMVVGFARLNGYVIGIVANQPMVLAGCIDIKASVKAAHFIRLCDAYNIPIVTLQDVPGFLPGTQPGVWRHHPQRCAHDLRVQRGNRAQAHDHPAQELWRRLLRHEFQGAARRPALRLAECRDCRDGRRRARSISSSRSR